MEDRATILLGIRVDTKNVVLRCDHWVDVEVKEKADVGVLEALAVLADVIFTLKSGDCPLLLVRSISTIMAPLPTRGRRAVLLLGAVNVDVWRRAKREYRWT